MAGLTIVADERISSSFAVDTAPSSPSAQSPPRFLGYFPTPCQEKNAILRFFLSVVVIQQVFLNDLIPGNQIPIGRKIESILRNGQLDNFFSQ